MKEKQLAQVQAITDLQEERSILLGVGFQIIKEAENYVLLERKGDFAFLMKGWIVQGQPSEIIDALTSGEPDFPLAFEADLWEKLLELIRTEGI